MKSRRETACEKPHDWTPNELGVLHKHGRLGAKAVMEMLNAARTTDRAHVAPLTLSAVYCKAHELRVSLRRDGSRRGRRMGVPAGMRIGDLGPHAAAVREGTLDLVTVELRIAGDLREPSLCPACGKRPQRNPMTGLCNVCHRRRLSAALQEMADETAARREYDVVKQRAHRDRDCIVDGCTHNANGTGGMCWTHARMKREGRL